MKIFLKKLLVCILVFLTIFNFMYSAPVQASVASFASNSLSTLVNWITTIQDGLLGIITYLYRIPIWIVIIIVMALMSGIAGTFGYVDAVGNTVASSDVGFLGPDDIFFNKLLLTDANVFKIITTGENPMPDAIVQVRQSVALWYYAMRVIAISVLLAILVYIAIRMAISSVASEKAAYKKMLINWASSIALVFVLHYVIVGVSYFNGALIEILGSFYENIDVDSVMGDLLGKALLPNFVLSTASTVVLVMLVVQTLAFLIYYIKRMLTISFLIIISPLITITYSIDKLGDNKAQALNTWMKEFFFTVIIQPFHCIIYMAFVSMSFSLLTRDDPFIITDGALLTNILGSAFGRIVAGILSVLCIKFIWDAEKMIKNIFGIKVSETLGDAVASAAVAGAVVSKGLSTASKAGSGAKKLSSTFKSAKTGTNKLMDKFRDSSLGQKLGFDNSELHKQTKEWKKDKKYAKKNGIDISKINTEKGIKDLHAQRVAADKKKEENKITNKIANSKPVQAIKGFMKTQEGMQLKRVLSSSAGVAAAIMGGAATYGANAKTSLFEAGVAGYGSYKGIQGMTMRLMNKKTDDYGETVKKSQKTMEEIRGTPEEAKGNPEEAVRNYIDASRKDKDKELSGDKMSEKEKKARKNIRKLLARRDNYDKGDDNEEIDYIMRDLQNGIFLNDLNMDELAEKYNLDTDDVRGAVGEFAEAKLYKQMAQDNKDIDNLAGQDGYYKIALEALAGSAAFNAVTSSTNAPTEPVETSTGEEDDDDSNSERTVTTEIDESEDVSTVEEHEHETETHIDEEHTLTQEELKSQKEYTDKVATMYNTWNEINGTENDGDMNKAIQNQIMAAEMEEKGELSKDKMQDRYLNTCKEVEQLVAVRDGIDKKDVDAKEIVGIVAEISKGILYNNLNIGNVASKAGLNENDLRRVIEDWAKAFLIRRMAQNNADINEKAGNDDYFKTALASLVIPPKESGSNKNDDSSAQTGTSSNKLEECTRKAERMAEILDDYKFRTVDGRDDRLDMMNILLGATRQDENNNEIIKKILMDESLDKKMSSEMINSNTSLSTQDVLEAYKKLRKQLGEEADKEIEKLADSISDPNEYLKKANDISKSIKVPKIQNVVEQIKTEKHIEEVTEIHKVEEFVEKVFKQQIYNLVNDTLEKDNSGDQ